MAEPTTSPGGVEYASFKRRALAALLDNSVWLIGLSWLFGDALGIVYDESPDAAGVIVIVLVSAWFNYFTFAEWKWGQTIGKNATGIEVRMADGDPKVPFGPASIRNLLRIVDFFVIGWIMVLATKRHQRLGDKAAKTVVVRRPSRGASARGSKA